MATTKAKAAAPGKAKTVKKKAPVKKQTVVTKTHTKVAAEPSFFEFRITQQTLYWLVLGVISIIFALWIVSLDSRIQKLYDEIDTSASSIDQPMPMKKQAANE